MKALLRLHPLPDLRADRDERAVLSPSGGQEEKHNKDCRQEPAGKEEIESAHRRPLSDFGKLEGRLAWAALQLAGRNPVAAIARLKGALCTNSWQSFTGHI
jgi:hypothetical protein